MQNKCYGVYYYYENFFGPANVVIIYMSTNLNKVIEFVKNNFTHIKENINNCLRCIHNKKNCIVWVNEYQLNTVIESNGSSCNQPHSSIDIFQYL